MDTFMLWTVLLYLEVCFVLSRSQGNHILQPIIRNVSMTEHFYQLKLEWDVHGDSKAYSPETKLIFNIQVNQTEENRIVLDVFEKGEPLQKLFILAATCESHLWEHYFELKNKTKKIPASHIMAETNYSVPLSKLNQSLEWSWNPLVPLQCEPHVIRIRSLVVDKNIPHFETWTVWSPWIGVTGLPTVDDNENNIFPAYQTVEEGSNVTVCCIAKKASTVVGLFSFNTENKTNTMDRKMYFYLKNVSQDFPNVVCSYKNMYTNKSDEPRGTELIVIGLPKKPKDFTCKTEAMMSTCSWKTEKRNSKHSVCGTELVLTDVRPSIKTYCKKLQKEEEDSCSFRTGEEQIPNLRLTAKNCFGEEYTDYPSEVTDSEKKSVVIILSLGIISLLLLMCICICSIYCIRRRCFSTIPKPDVSPFLKRNPGTMKIYDVAPNKLEVMANHQTCNGKPNDLGMLIIENITYFDPADYPTTQEQEAKNKNLNTPSTLYKPLQDFFAVSPPSTSYTPLQDFFENKLSFQSPSQDQGNFSYTSEMEIPNSEAQLDDMPALIEDMQLTVYKPQQPTALETISPRSDDYVGFQNTFS